MNTSITNNDSQQLIPMRILSIDVNNEINKQTTSEINEQNFILRLISCPIQILRSLHHPHFSDRSLRIIFLLFITLIGLTSFTIALIIGSSIVQFKQQCPLYASFTFKTSTSIENNGTIKKILLSETFSSQSICDFCTFYNVFTFIYCIMTGFFFVLFNGDQRIVTTNDRCLIIPWFPISIILGFLGLINASILTNGFLKFCSTTILHDGYITSCTQLNQILVEKYPNVSLFFVYMLLAIIASWFQLAFFIGVIAILTIRLGSSFDWSSNVNKQSVEKP